MATHTTLKQGLITSPVENHFGFAVNGLVDDRNLHQAAQQIFTTACNFVQYNNARSQTKDPWTNLGFNFNIQQSSILPAKRISADLDYILYRTKGNQYSDNYLYNADGKPSEEPFAKGYLPGNIDIYSFKSDYKQPMKITAHLKPV